MEAIDQPFIEAAKVEVYGGFWKRFGAMLIDAIILTPVTYGLTYFNVIEWKSVEVLILISFIGLVYKPWMELQYGATFGKMAMKLRVVNIEHQEAAMNEIVLRNIFHITGCIASFLVTLYVHLDPGFETVSGWTEYSIFTQNFFSLRIANWLIISIIIVDGIVLLADKKNKALHDKIAKTLVVVK